MSEVPQENADCPNPRKSGPNYFAYYKHLVQDLFSESGECIVPFLEVGSAETVNSSSYFSDGVGEGLSQFKKERLKAVLNESAVRLNLDVDEILDQIFATSQIKSNLREKEQLASCSNDSLNEDFLHSKKRKAYSTSNSSGNNYGSFRQVYNKIQNLQEKDELCHEDVEKYTVHLLGELGTMERDLEEFLNIVMSKCRPMTGTEKHQLGKKIRKLPGRALDRVAEILQPSNFSASTLPENIVVNLEEQDNVTLWRLHYCVELMVKANKL